MEMTDVLIVGGGIAGASLGARLAGDAKVMIVEAEDMCGRHATGRSAAFWQASLDRLDVYLDVIQQGSTV